MDADFIRDLFREFGAVQIRRMFGGAGLWADDVMFALITREVIYLKTDDESIPAFEAENCSPFSYTTKNGRHTLTSYWRLPERLYDDPEELAVWARRALAVARAKSVGKVRVKTRPAAKAGVGRKAKKKAKKAVEKTATRTAKSRRKKKKI